jgi:hypothetical protein
MNPFTGKIVRKIQHLFFFGAGLVFLFLAKVKNLLRGYCTPKTFSSYDKSVEYDIHVVDAWLRRLKEYTGTDDYISGREVLELGPGADLGAGIYLLCKGSSKYNAIDINNLLARVSDEFYRMLFDYLRGKDGKMDKESLSAELAHTKNGRGERLNYICRKDFDIGASFKEESIDLIFSQAAFECFDDVEKTVSQLSVVAKSGAVLISEIDLKTHSRWIRDIDPNNIYRYPEWMYRLFRYRGIPNRVRPCQYEKIFSKYGWGNIKIIAQGLIPESDFEKLCTGLNGRFKDGKNRMDILSMVICARKK